MDEYFVNNIYICKLYIYIYIYTYSVILNFIQRDNIILDYTEVKTGRN